MNKFAIKGKYTGKIERGLVVGGSYFYPELVSSSDNVDIDLLARLTKGEENGWFKIIECKPANPFIKSSVEIPTTEKEVVETPAEEVVETPIEEVVEEEKPVAKKTKAKKKTKKEQVEE